MLINKTMEADLQAFINLYRRFGVVCKVNKQGENQVIYLSSDDQLSPDLLGDVTNSDKFNGHPHFFATVSFDADGKFIEQGFWE